MKAFVRWLIPCVVPILAAAACVGDDPSGSAEPDGGDSDASTGPSGAPRDGSAGDALAPDAASSLNCPAQCHARAPVGWSGPFAVHDHRDPSAAPACAAPYSATDLERIIPRADAPTCGCKASAASCTYETSIYSGACGEGPIVDGTFTFRSDSECASFDNASSQVPTAQGFQVSLFAPASAAADLSAASCGTHEPNVPFVGDAAVGGRIVSCALPENVACSTGAGCVQTPPADAAFGRFCIHAEGDQACPSADYPQKVLTATSVVDGRSCSCGAPAGGSCAPGDALVQAALGVGSASCGAATSSLALSVRSEPKFADGQPRCLQINVAPSQMFVTAVGLAPAGVTCADVVTGELQPTGLETFCCER